MGHETAHSRVFQHPVIGSSTHSNRAHVGSQGQKPPQGQPDRGLVPCREEVGQIRHGYPHGIQKFLFVCMGPAAAFHTLAAAERGEVQDAPVDHFGVVPVVGAGTEKNHGLPSGLFGVLGKLTGHPNHVFTEDSGDCLLPCGSVGPRVVIPPGDLLTLAPVDPEVSHEKIEDGGDEHIFPVKGDLLDRDRADSCPRPLNREKGEGGIKPAIVIIGEAEKGVHELAGCRILGLEVPAAFLTPPKPDAAVGDDKSPAQAIEVDGLPFGVVIGESQVGGTQVPSGSVRVSLLIENHREREIGESLRIGAEVFRLPIQVELLQDDTGHGHGQGGVGPGSDREPGNSKLHVFGIVRSDGRDSGSAVACYCFRFSRFSTMLRQATTGSPSACSASRHISMRVERMKGYFRRMGL